MGVKADFAALAGTFSRTQWKLLPQPIQAS
jgi:hypothetical protein